MLFYKEREGIRMFSGQCSHLFLFFPDFSIDAPPSFKPAKKYSDVSGLLVSTVIQLYILNIKLKRFLSSWCSVSTTDDPCLESVFCEGRMIVQGIYVAICVAAWKDDCSIKREM